MLGKSPEKIKIALICGVSGQDGAYLSQLLLSKGYKVVGTSRDINKTEFKHLEQLNILPHIQLRNLLTENLAAVFDLLEHVQADEIYNLAGQSSVGFSFEYPVETFTSISIGTLNLLEAIRRLKLKARLFNAGSSECFGESTALQPLNEKTAFLPRSPYAVAKTSAYWQIANYREAYDIYACTGHLFNHESPFRGQRFVTTKIINTVINIYRGKQSLLELGNVDIIRDWGWAPEYVEAMWKMLQQDKAQDFIIATGKSISLRNFVNIAFDYFGLDIQQHLHCNESLLRPTDIRCSYANVSKANELLAWQANTQVEDVIKMMIEDKLKGN